MNQVIRRNKNADKQRIDYDLNIYMPEQLDQGGNSYWDPASWMIHVYVVDFHSHEEWDGPIQLTADEIVKLGLNIDPYFRDETDTWYGLDGFLLEYWDKMSDRLKMYFDNLPRYYEDMIV